jgi:hypothetical protein
MRGFQQDECLNGKAFRAACNSQKLCQVHKFPTNLHGTKDPVLLPILLAGASPLLTVDRRIVDDNIQYIPNTHPGIIIIKTVNTKKSLTTSIASSIVQKFKAIYPAWHDTDWSGKCLEVDEINSALSVVRTSSIVLVESVPLAHPDFTSLFVNAVRAAHELVSPSPKPKEIESAAEANPDPQET